MDQEDHPARPVTRRDAAWLTGGLTLLAFAFVGWVGVRGLLTPPAVTLAVVLTAAVTWGIGVLVVLLAVGTDGAADG